MLTEMAFSDDFQYVKTKVKFSAEFHRSKSRESHPQFNDLDRRLRKEKEKSLFDASESNLVDGLNEEGNFHIKEQQYQKATTEGHYMPLFRRIEKIQTVLGDITNY